MISKPFLSQEGKLNILIDSQSFDSLLSKGDHSTRTLLEYSKFELFEFVRTPFDTNYSELKSMPVVIKEHYDKGDFTGLRIITATNELQSLVWFPCKMRDIEAAGKTIYKKASLSTDEKEAIILAYIQVALNRPTAMSVLVTNNEVLLENRLWFESHFNSFGPRSNIATVEEAKEIMDLFAKHRGKYCICSYYFSDKWGWYQLSFKSKVPKCHTGEDSILNALANRFCYLLRSIDEMGFQYYSDVTNDTMENMIYHFNYFVSLVSGIFDNLSSRTKNQLSLKFESDDIPQRTSLNPKAGKEFLKALREENPALRKHISNNANFIKLIYHLRELVIHREMLQKASIKTFHGKRANLISVSNDTLDLIRLCGKNKQEYEPRTRWGVYTHELLPGYFLEPFHFSKTAASSLISFTNKYLELLGFSDLVEDEEREGEGDLLAATPRIFRQYNLGF